MTIQLKIKLSGITKPPVWRRLIIPAEFTFYDLHEAIQRAFEWEGYHLFQFEARPFSRGWRITDMSDGDGGLDGGEEARDLIVGDLIIKGGLGKFVYVYDFGDSWVHEITVEKIYEKNELTHAMCVGGKGAPPPEDCGGPWGYMQMRDTILKGGEEADEYLEWMGLDSREEFDPNRFSEIETDIRVSMVYTTSKNIKNRNSRRGTPDWESSDLFEDINMFGDNTEYEPDNGFAEAEEVTDSKETKATEKESSIFEPVIIDKYHSDDRHQPVEDIPYEHLKKGKALGPAMPLVVCAPDNEDAPCMCGSGKPYKDCCGKGS